MGGQGKGEGVYKSMGLINIYLQLFEKLQVKFCVILKLFLLAGIFFLWSTCCSLSWYPVHECHKHYRSINFISIIPLYAEDYSLFLSPSSMLDKCIDHMTLSIVLLCTFRRCYSYISFCCLSIVKCFWYNLEKQRLQREAFICEKTAQAVKYIWHSSSLYIVDFRLS